MKNNLRVALIGTGWISKKMLDATLTIEGVEVVGIYSRNEEKTRSIAYDWGIKHVYHSLDELMNDDIDFVYLASPTKHHHAYLSKLIAHNIPVLCEKPITVNLKQLEDVVKNAIHQNVFVIEAMKTMYTPNFKQLKSSLHLIGKPTRVYFTFERASLQVEDDRYRSALLDIGVYPIAVSVALFGYPIDIQGQLKCTPNKMDTDGHIILNYEGFDVVIDYSKEVVSDNVNRIIGTEGTLLFEHVSEVRTLDLIDLSGNKKDLSLQTSPNTLIYELSFMRDLLNSHNNSVLIDRQDEIECVFKIMDSIREQHQLVFDED